MPDGVEFKMVTEPFMAAIKDRERRMDKATMWVVREVARTVKKEARRSAPVLKDANAIRLRQFRKLTSGWGDAGPVVGLLRSSISPSKRLRKEGGGYALKVGPRGPRVHLYAAKQEQRTEFMAKGYAAGMAQVRSIAERGFGATWAADHGG